APALLVASLQIATLQWAPALSASRTQDGGERSENGGTPNPDPADRRQPRRLRVDPGGPDRDQGSGPEVRPAGCAAARRRLRSPPTGRVRHHPPRPLATGQSGSGDLPAG